MLTHLSSLLTRTRSSARWSSAFGVALVSHHVVDGAEHTVSMPCSALLDKSVQVDWARQVLLQPESVLQTITRVNQDGMIFET